MSTVQRTRSRRKTPWVNRVIAGVLRSPLSRLVDRSIMLLTVVGRHSGRRYTFPVQYVEDGPGLWVFTGVDPTAKTWWRNLVGGGDVEIQLRGRARTGRAVAYLTNQHPEVVQEGLSRYVDRFPSTASRLGISASDEGRSSETAERTVIVRIDLDDPEGDPGGRDG
jgi:deazaflavin-dependent oxidoreductase (nitroreductase family)